MTRNLHAIADPADAPAEFPSAERADLAARIVEHRAARLRENEARLAHVRAKEGARVAASRLEMALKAMEEAKDTAAERALASALGSIGNSKKDRADDAKAQDDIDAARLALATAQENMNNQGGVLPAVEEILAQAEREANRAGEKLSLAVSRVMVSEAVPRLIREAEAARENFARHCAVLNAVIHPLTMGAHFTQFIEALSPAHRFLQSTPYFTYENPMVSAPWTAFAAQLMEDANARAPK